MGEPSDSQLKQFVSALILRAIRDALEGDRRAARWLRGARAARWAEQLSLRSWPPNLKQARRVLEERKLERSNSGQAGLVEEVKI